VIVAVIPARGGSKRLPRKNILPFAGRPLLAWSIAAAQTAPSVRSAWVSTDDDEIASVAEAHGARVIRRPAAFAGDDSSTLDVIVHALQSIRVEGITPTAVMTLQPTNPLRPVAMIEEAVTRFTSSPCDSLVSVSVRPLKAGRIVAGYFEPAYDFGQQSRLAEPIAFENGLLYITRVATLDSGSLCGKRILAFETARPFDEVDIDEPADIKLGECILAAVRDMIDY
jgi:CMP-N-acetylneuraminic acid synthetase